jgi:DtxR family Mn-dependent transcriptional regulator
MENTDVVYTNDIAAEMNTKAASVTDMILKLASKKQVNYKKYKGLTLTEKGRKTALAIIRKHRLWEMFLVEKLDFRWDEVHDVAEQLEHINSDKLIEQVEKALNFPKFDPHGDPIPDVNGKIAVQKSMLLSSAAVSDKTKLTGVIDHSTDFLRYLEKCGIKLGCEIKLEEENSYDKSLLISVNKGKSFFISNQVAKNLLIIKQ